MFKRQHYMALIAVVVTILIILNLPNRTTARLKVAIGSLFLPLFGLASSTHEIVNKASDVITTRAELLKQNEALQKMVWGRVYSFCIWRTAGSIVFRTAESLTARSENLQIAVAAVIYSIPARSRNHHRTGTQSRVRFWGKTHLRMGAKTRSKIAP